MRCKFLLMGVVGLWSLGVWGQAPDYQAIADSIANPSSPYYYPVLLGRYERGDTTLTIEDYRYLYYGHPEQEAYKPLLGSSLSDSLAMAFGTRVAPTRQTFDKAIRYAKALLAKQPFNLRDLNVLAYAYAQLGDTVAAAQQMRKMDRIMAVITTSGTGLSEESPWYVTYYTHAQDVLNVERIEVRDPMVISRAVQFYPLVDEQRTAEGKRVRGYYFDVSPIYAKRPDYLDEFTPKKRGVEVNPQFDPRKTYNKKKK